jgi:hypothetical protein
VLTSRRVGRVLAAGTGTIVPPAVALTAVVTVMTVIAWTPARSQELRATGGVSGTSCVGGFATFNCVTRWGPAGDPYVRPVPAPVDERERARLEARDRNWLARCNPIVERDRYGVGRLRYAAPGCEFGVGED